MKYVASYVAVNAPIGIAYVIALKLPLSQIT